MLTFVVDPAVSNNHNAIRPAFHPWLTFGSSVCQYVCHILMTPSEIASGAVGRIQRRTEVVVVMEHTYFIKDFLFEWTCAHCGISRRKTQPQSGFSQIREKSDIFMATGVLSPGDLPGVDPPNPKAGGNESRSDAPGISGYA